MAYLCNVKSNKDFFDCIKILKARGIKTSFISRSSSIVGRRNEKNILCKAFQIVEPDDIPEGFEVVYSVETNGFTSYSYEDPVFCDFFYAMIFKKRERKTDKLINANVYMNR